MHLQHFFHAVPWLLHQNQRKLAAFEPWIVAFQNKASRLPPDSTFLADMAKRFLVLYLTQDDDPDFHTLGMGKQPTGFVQVDMTLRERDTYIYIYYIYIFTYSCTYICTVAARKCKKTTALRNFEFMHWARRSPPRIIQRNKSLWNGKNTFTTDINWLRVFQCDLC